MSGRHHFKSVDILFALTLFVVFAVSVLMVLLSGARIYRDSVDGMTAQYGERTSLSYIATRLRGFDGTGRIQIAPMDGHSDALYMISEHDGVEYQTVIYLYEGQVMEYFGVYEPDFSPRYGSEILRADALLFEREGDGIVRIAYQTNDGWAETRVYLRSEGAIV